MATIESQPMPAKGKATPAEQPAKDKGKSAPAEQPSGREYIVFGHAELVVSGENAWQEVGRSTAAHAETARDAVIDTLPLDEQGGPFVTIAARYWTPESFDVVQPPPVRKAKA